MKKFIQFIKNSFREIRYNMTWPSAKAFQNIVFGFFFGAIIWVLFLYGVNELSSKIQESVYDWLTITNN